MEQSRIEVAYLSYDGLTDPLGQSQIIPYVVGLNAKGYHFTIFSFEKPQAFQSFSNDIGNKLLQHNIDWRPLPYTKWPPVLSTVWDLWRLRHVYSRANNTSRFQIIHCRSYLTSLIGLWAQRKFKAKFIFDMRGFWADERVEGALWNLKNPVYKLVYNFFKKKEKEFLIKADHSISLTENAKREILTWGLNESGLTVIPTCVDLKLFNPENTDMTSQQALRKKLGIGNDEFVLLYLGSWGTWYLTNAMLNFFNQLKTILPASKFLIVSGDKIDLDGYSDKNDVIVTQVSRSAVPLHIALANLAICFIKPSYSKKASSATKVSEILSMNVPLVLNDGWGDTEALAGVTYLIRENNFNNFNIARILDWKKTAKDTDKTPHLQSHSLEYGINSYHSVYKRVLGRN